MKSPPPSILRAQHVKETALAAGFAACGIAPAAPITAERAAERAEMLRRGHHAGMEWLERNEDKRRDPRLLLPGARTVISLAWPYPPRHAEAPPIAAYALGTDYHVMVKDALWNLVRQLADSDESTVRCFVDTAPIDERYWAWKAGVGFIGRSGMLIIPQMGSRFFLGEILTTLPADTYDVPLTPDIAAHSLCGTCRRCIDACPGKALTAHGLDARRCLSYLTIEHRGPLPPQAARWMHATPGTPLFYGCDRCTEVCPYNTPKRAVAGDDAMGDSAARDCTMPANADFWKQLSIADYRQIFRGSAVKRAKYEGLMRNIRAFFGEESAETDVPDSL